MDGELSARDSSEQAAPPVNAFPQDGAAAATADINEVTDDREKTTEENTQDASEQPPQLAPDMSTGAQEFLGDAPTPSHESNHSAKHHGKGTKRVSFPAAETPGSIVMTEATPVSSSAPPTRGRPIGRPKGSRARGTTRASTRGGRGGKRKRAEAEDDDDSSGSEIFTSTALTTKSGRSIQKPTAFVPPPQPSPTTVSAYKKKRTFRRNPDSAVCKICLRGVSPASNMIVFCDGCNTPYHRYCHQPPIDQSVIDEVDKEWFCKQCERERIEPVPAAEIEGFVTGQGASAEERQKYFSSLPPGLLVTLLTRATTLQPELPVFDPTFQPKSVTTPHIPSKPAMNGHAHPPIPPPAASNPPTPAPANVAATIFREAEDSDDNYGSDEHPSHYPRPGQGFMATLPPDRDDVRHLVDDDNARGVFAHMYQIDAEAANARLGAEREE